ncbi:MAG: bifunctional proline dehydrogenase/L-glutamate gamma-semialdehyde dehydrogenase, partial [Thiohalomonadaceae bacterium]
MSSAGNDTRHPRPLPSALAEAHLADEALCMERLLDEATFSPEQSLQVSARAAALVRAAREHGPGGLPFDAFLAEYGLDNREGILLMCLAEGLLRIPDAATADALIRDKLSPAHWDVHLGHSRSLLVNASTWGLLLTGRLVALDEEAERGAGH